MSKLPRPAQVRQQQQRQQQAEGSSMAAVVFVRFYLPTPIRLARMRVRVNAVQCRRPDSIRESVANLAKQPHT